MEIKDTLLNRSGQELRLVYREEDPHKNLGDAILHGVHAYCFRGDDLVIVYTEEKDYWTPPGGAIEEGEHYEDAVIREVLEESNMHVLNQKLLGYQDIFEPERVVRQTRSVCIVEPKGEFEGDPDGDITEIKLINPKDIKKYFDWGKVGNHLIKKALEEKGNLQKELSSRGGIIK